MAKLRMAHASTHGARKPGPKNYLKMANYCHRLWRVRKPPVPIFGKQYIPITKQNIQDLFQKQSFGLKGDLWWKTIFKGVKEGVKTNILHQFIFTWWIKSSEK